MLLITVKSLKMFINTESTNTGLVGSDSSFKSQKQYKKPSSTKDSVYCYYAVLNNPKETNMLP